MDSSTAAGRPYLLPTLETFIQVLGAKTEPKSVKVLVQSPLSCTTSVHFSAEAPSMYRTNDLLVRFEDSPERIKTASALQRLAHIQIREYVPETFDAGTCVLPGGRTVGYSVSEFVRRTTILEDVWQDCSEDQQERIMDEVCSALARMQQLRLEHDDVQRILESTEFIKQEPSPLDVIRALIWKRPKAAGGGECKVEHRLGGPDLGYFKDTPAFLSGVVEALEPNGASSSIDMYFLGDMMTIESTYADLADVQISRSDLESLQYQSVLCHNDLEPRNILVYKVPATEITEQHFRLAAITGWDRAGFYPFSYEYYLKDALLGSPNSCYSWYKLFKRKTASLLSPIGSNEALVRAVDLIHASVKRQMRRSVSVLLREDFLAEEGLVKGPGVYDGWFRMPNSEELRKYAEEDDEVLEEGEVKSLGSS